MVENIIIKTSYSKIPNGELKSNLGDLIRTSILLNLIKGDFLWITDQKSKNLLKYFIDPERIFNFEEAIKSDRISVNNIYNIDNYVPNKELLEKLKGNWHGYIYNGKKLFPQNELIEAITPYGLSPIKKSWQELLTEGVGFRWEQQDYPVPKIDTKETSDIGFNWHVQQDWTSKMWPEKNWKKLEKILEKEYSISWQQGLNNFDGYMQWLSSCKTIITCETLGLHLASALRKKVLAVVGPMENTEFPYGRVTLIKPKNKGCMPCNSPNCLYEKSCMEDITPERVYKEILNLFRNK